MANTLIEKFVLFSFKIKNLAEKLNLAEKFGLFICTLYNLSSRYVFRLDPQTLMCVCDYLPFY